MAQEDFTTLKAIGDGNCLFRSILQSLLMQGLIEDKKTAVIEFINGLVQRTEEDLRLNGMEINANHVAALRDNPDFKDHAQIDGSTLTINKPYSFHEFIEKYQSLPLEQWKDFSSTYFDNNNPPVLYYLSACLRMDILSYHIKCDDLTEERLNDFGSLHTYADAINCAGYLNTHKIKTLVTTENDNSSLSDYSSPYEHEEDEENDYKIHIYLKYTDNEAGKHYDALLLTEELPLQQTETDAEKLQPEEIKPISEQKQTIKPDQTLAETPKMEESKMLDQEAQIKEDAALAEILQTEENEMLDQEVQVQEDAALAETLQTEESEMLEKELQIKEDKAIAKDLQMEEIVCFSEKFKSSGNKNNLSFISDVIRGLGLEKELGAEQLSHLQALQNSATIEQVIQSLQSVINELGYSSQFKEQIQHHSFFSTCRQEVTDTAQTLSVTPTIKCH